MPKKGLTARRNINFRHSPREFRAQKQLSVFMHINKNIAYAHQVSKQKFSDTMQKLNSKFRPK